MCKSFILDLKEEEKFTKIKRVFFKTHPVSVPRKLSICLLISNSRSIFFVCTDTHKHNIYNLLQNSAQAATLENKHDTIE